MARRPSTAVEFSPYEISMCLYDMDRTKAWKQAIEDSVEEGDVVVDAGAGTGILGVFAARAGAARVYSVEIHPRFCRLTSRLAMRNGVGDRITVMNGDASRIDLPEQIDLVICELLCTGQFFEPEVQVINNLRRFFGPRTRVIPQKMESFIQLITAQPTLYGVHIDTDSRSIVLVNDEPVSSIEQYDVIDFTRSATPDRVDTSVVVRARANAIADAAMITSKARLTNGVTAARSRFLYNPEVIYLKNPLELAKGNHYEVRISYAYGCDTLDVELEVKPCPRP